MAYVSLARGLYFPEKGPRTNLAGGNALDAATDKTAMIGQIYIAGRATNKTISAAGGGSIGFKTEAGVTFANGSTTLQVGIQDVSTSTGLRPDGTFDVSRVLVGGTDTITSSVWNTFAMTGGSGTKTISHGDLIAVVLDMTARGGADTITLSAAAGSTIAAFNSTQFGRPGMQEFSAGAWLTSATRPANCVIVFDDGTVAHLDGGGFWEGTATAEAYANTTNPDERGIIFQTPFNCKVDGAWMDLGISSLTASDFTVTLYSDPLGTPASMAQVVVLAEQWGTPSAGTHSGNVTFAETTLTRNTNYGLAIKADSTSNVTLQKATLGSENYRALLPGGTTYAKITRDGGSGAFTAESPAVSLYDLAVRISAFDDGTGSGTGAAGIIGG